MPFVQFTVQSREKVALGTGFAASLKRLKTAPAALTLTLRPQVADELHWQDQQAFAVLVGEGPEQGLLRLRADPAGSAQLVRRHAGSAAKAYFNLALGHVPNLPNRSEGKRWVKYEVVEDGWVEVVLPSWADPPKAAATPPVLSSAVAMHGARPGGESVVSRMMGDPPPGRSALHQQQKQPPAPTRGEARRAAEEREAPEFSEAERASVEREISEADYLGRAMTTFGLSKTEAKYLITLMDGRLATKDRLLDAGHEDSEEIDPKSVDVYVHKLRAKLNTRLVAIETVRAQGYRMTPENIARVRRLMAEAADAPASEAAE